MTKLARRLAISSSCNCATSKGRQVAYTPRHASIIFSRSPYPLKYPRSPHSPRWRTPTCPSTTNPTLAPPVLLQTWRRASTPCSSALCMSQDSPNLCQKAIASPRRLLVSLKLSACPQRQNTDALGQDTEAYTMLPRPHKQDRMCSAEHEDRLSRSCPSISLHKPS
jgi:hypothetical protein